MNNLKKVVLSIFAGFLIFGLKGCKCDVSEDVIGKYSTEIKGIEIRDTTKGIEALGYLKMMPNNTFLVFNDEKSIKISGSWNIIDCEFVKNNFGDKEPESTIEFIFNKKRIEGKYRGNRITFIYPNDFYSGRYESLWYIKLEEDKQGNVSNW